IQKLRREIKVWADLDHINVLPLFGISTDFGQLPAMVCPWLENGPLTSYLERVNEFLTTGNRLALVGIRCNFASSAILMSTLQYIVHGDLSGSNVLINDDGRACIADFGLSMLLTALGAPTFATSFKARGAFRWVAPELLNLNAQPSEDEEALPRVPPTTRSDIFSLGRIILQVLSGQIPFYYYHRDERVVLAISKEEIPKRPQSAVFTDRRWNFIQGCWSTIDEGQLRPSVEEIVEFTRRELAEIG
ncbi:kinase-like domain-containing protein, partial [Melanogaster broomeanus]